TSAMSSHEILEALGLKDRKSMADLYLRPALQSEFVEMTIPDKPTSKNQKYRITDKGRAILAIETKGK
ncbi:MAG: hypothetical protein JXM68_02725, partial [Sedimentisphaerales bacterium]|nr:hypothetical protein [Sedimentisphaerales bacterium]